ncbi:hypothetical protein [Lentzea sp. NPDC003310]|uniref:hypothetical protein n=1 Tax=Lentzea sp. NPDC003310 TaxID=3154447 RepID=UPI0033ADB21C
MADLQQVRPHLARRRRNSAVATAELLHGRRVGFQGDCCSHHRVGVAAVTLQHSDDSQYAPAGTEQIALDEIRLRKHGLESGATSLCLRAVGHQLKAEPDLVEQALELIVSHDDEQVAVSAASLLAKLLLDGVPREHLRSPISFPMSFSLPDELDDEDRHAWQQNVRAASVLVSAYAAGNPASIEAAITALRGEGTFEVLAVLVTAAARKLERHAAWFGEALRCAELSNSGPTVLPASGDGR